MGDVDEGIARQARLHGEPIPERIANKPVIRATEQFWFQAFMDLDTERAHGQGLVKIPWSAIVNYANECGLNYEEKQELIFVIRRVDDMHINELAKQRANPS